MGKKVSSGILWDKTMKNKPNNDKTNYSFCESKLLIENIESASLDQNYQNL